MRWIIIWLAIFNGLVSYYETETKYSYDKHWNIWAFPLSGQVQLYTEVR